MGASPLYGSMSPKNVKICWCGLVPEKDVKGPPSESATCHATYYETLRFPCSGPAGKGLWNWGVYMAMPKNRQVGTSMKEVPNWFVPFTRTLFGNTNSRFWSACFKKGKVTPHPIYELAADRIVNAVSLISLIFWPNKGLCNKINNLLLQPVIGCGRLDPSHWSFFFFSLSSVYCISPSVQL